MNAGSCLVARELPFFPEKLTKTAYGEIAPSLSVCKFPVYCMPAFMLWEVGIMNTMVVKTLVDHVLIRVVKQVPH